MNKILGFFLKKLVKSNLQNGLNYENLRKYDANLKKENFYKKINQVETLYLSKKDKPKSIIIHLSGGAFVCGPNQNHVNFAKFLFKNTTSNIILINYLKSPENNYKQIMNSVIKVYETLIKEEKYEKIYLSGDSAGGGLACSVIYEIKRLKLKLPKKLLLISPWLDLSLTNPKITKKVDNDDSTLSKKGLIIARNYYKAELNEKNPKISPINGDLTLLPKTLLISGNKDMLIYDIRLFYEKCVKKNVKIKYLEYENEIHDFLLMPFNGKNKIKAEKEIIKFLE